MNTKARREALKDSKSPSWKKWFASPNGKTMLQMIQSLQQQQRQPAENKAAAELKQEQERMAQLASGLQKSPLPTAASDHAMTTATHTHDELGERYSALRALIKKRPDVNDIKKRIRSHLRTIWYQKIERAHTYLPLYHLANWIPLESKWELYGNIAAAINSGDWSKLPGADTYQKASEQRIALEGYPRKKRGEMAAQLEAMKNCGM
jgi:hypothetical protein